MRVLHFRFCTVLAISLGLMASGWSVDADQKRKSSAPAAPTDLVAQATSDTAVSLTWLDNSSNENSFPLEQWIDGAFKEIQRLPKNTTTAQVLGLTPATGYSFRVRAKRGRYLYSAYSNIASATTDDAPTPPPPPPGAPSTPFYAYYYLWWKLDHWESKLGPEYPWDSSWPMPGELDEQTGCDATANFLDSRLFDLPPDGPYDATKAAIYPVHVNEAAQAGLTGFLVGWHGPGTTDQTVTSEGKNRRLDLMVQAVRDYNASHVVPFTYIIDYQTFSNVWSPTWIGNDIDYLLSNYGDDPAWGRMDGRLVFRWSNTKNYPTSTLQEIYERFSDRLFIIGEERPYTWTSTRAQYLEGSGRYWSTQDPYRNPASFRKNREFADQIHADGRLWFAPLTAGYNDELNELYYGDPVEPDDCVPRKGAETLNRLYEGNLTSSPDGWFVISWNEWVEHTYIQPSKRYGTFYLDELARLIAASE